MNQQLHWACSGFQCAVVISLLGTDPGKPLPPPNKPKTALLAKELGTSRLLRPSDTRSPAYQIGVELDGASQAVELPQPDEQWVPTGENLPHQIFL